MRTPKVKPRRFMKFPILVAGMVTASLLRAVAFDAASFAFRVDFPASSGQVNVAFGDLDGDGKPDAVIGNYFGNTVSVYRNTGTSGIVDASTFAAPANFTVGNRPLQVQLADLDGDGKLDIVSVNELGGTVSLLRNTATVGALAHFNASIAPGRFNGGARSIPGTAAGQTVSGQVKVWDSADGATYEEAVAAGGKRGASPVFQISLGGGLQPPAMLSRMPSFAVTLPGISASPLPAPAPPPAVVKLMGLVRSSEGWTLTIQGSASATCAIEASTDFIHWTTIAYVVNERGIVKYTDSDTSAPARFYRVKIISD